MRRILVGFALIASWIPAGASRAAADEPPPSESVLARSQPSVFLTVTYADFRVTIPRRVVLAAGADGVSLVEAEYERMLAAGKIKTGVKKSDMCWALIADDPSRLLQVAEAETKVEPMEAASTGTAFAVSREGVLLTNAHNVADPADGALPIWSLRNVLDRTVDEISGMTAAQGLVGLVGSQPRGPSLGGRPPALAVNALITRMHDWLLGQSKSSGNKFRQMVVMMDYRAKADVPRPFSLLPPNLTAILRAGSPETQRALRNKSEDLVLMELMSGRGVTRFADVLAIGQGFPGKDVAVLKLGASAPFAPPDNLICLPLGDSDRVRLGSNVLALGFPVAAFNPEIMKEEARFRVITEDGKITQRVPLKTGIDVFHMTAQINHGHSGGPVVDPFGRVIAINVARGEDNMRYALPINVAKEFLDRAGVKVDPGPVTPRWLAGHDLFQKGDYAQAAREFQWVADMQTGKMSGINRTPDRVLSGDVPANSYVSAMIRECRARSAGK